MDALIAATASRTLSSLDIALSKPGRTSHATPSEGSGLISACNTRRVQRGARLVGALEERRSAEQRCSARTVQRSHREEKLQRTATMATILGTNGSECTRRKTRARSNDGRQRAAHPDPHAEFPRLRARVWHRPQLVQHFVKVVLGALVAALTDQLLPLRHEARQLRRAVLALTTARCQP